MSKAQAISTDLFFAVAVFMVLVGGIIFIWDFYSLRLSEDSEYNEMLVISFQATDLLAKKTLGEDRNLSTAKVGSFFNQSYDEIRGELNIRNYDFYISLEGGANSSGLAASKGKKSSNSENVISLRRYTTYQNENSVLSFELWK